MSDITSTLGGRVLQVSGLQESLLVAVSLGVRDPDRLLGIIDLGLVSPRHIHRGEQELRGVGVHGPLDQLDMAGHV